MNLTSRPAAGAPAANQYGVFTVHYATPKQVAFLKRLMAERDTSGVADVAELRAQVAAGRVNKKAASAAIEVLLSAPVAVAAPAAPTPVAYPASDKQVALIAKLAAEKDTSGLTPFSTGVLDTVISGGVVSKRDASALIDYLFACPRRMTAQGTVAARVEGAPVEGMHYIDGQVVKVQRAVHGSGNLYAKVLDVETSKFEYAPGMVSRTSEATLMTKEQAKEFGRLYGMCAKCAATLTDEESIERGYGPVCAKSFR